MPRVVWLAAALLAALPAPADAFFGTNSQPLVKLQVAAPDRWGSFFGAQARDGLSTSRSDALWSAVEPNAPLLGLHDHRWTNADPTKSIDGIVATMASQGVRWAPVISTPPSWAGGAGRRVTPARYADLATFTAAVARRYGPGGPFWAENPHLPALPIEHVQLWTEANSTHFWTGGPDAAEYVAALRLVTPAVRAANPQVKVLVSLGWQDFEGYTDGLYAHGVKGLIDGFGFHPYAPHATAVLDLVQRMRSRLRAHGDGDLPIHITEIGQAAALGGDGAVSAAAGPVSDRARGATHALAGEALARSDCGVRSYLLYALVGSETGREPDNEGYMGTYRVADAAPSETAAALREAATRVRGAPSGALRLCSPEATPPSQLLALELRPTAVDTRCATATVTFDGRPFESAFLVLRTPAGQTARAESDAFGHAQACLPAAASTFTATAEVADVATSPTLTCVDGRCTEGTAPAAPAPPQTSTKAKGCWRLEGRVLAAGRRTTRVRARIRCAGGATPKTTRIAVALQRKGTTKRTTLRRITLRRAAPLRFTLRTRLRAGDRLFLLHRPTAKVRRAGGPPALTQAVAR